MNEKIAAEIDFFVHYTRNVQNKNACVNFLAQIKKEQTNK